MRSLRTITRNSTCCMVINILRVNIVLISLVEIRIEPFFQNEPACVLELTSNTYDSTQAPRSRVVARALMETACSFTYLIWGSLLKGIRSTYSLHTYAIHTWYITKLNINHQYKQAWLAFNCQISILLISSQKHVRFSKTIHDNIVAPMRCDSNSSSGRLGQIVRLLRQNGGNIKFKPVLKRKPHSDLHEYHQHSSKSSQFQSSES